MAYSSVYIKEEYISSENDVLNNEIFKIATKVYKRKLKTLDKTYKQNRQKLYSLENLLKNLKQKIDKTEQKKQNTKVIPYVDVNKKINNIIDSFSSIKKENISSIDLNAFVTPVYKFSVEKKSKDGFLLLKPIDNNKVVATLNGKIVYIDKLNNGFFVILRHQNNIFSIYLDLDAIKQHIAIGQKINAGEVLGYATNTIAFKITHRKKTLDALFLISAK